MRNFFRKNKQELTRQQRRHLEIYALSKVSHLLKHDPTWDGKVSRAFLTAYIETMLSDEERQTAIDGVLV